MPDSLILRLMSLLKGTWLGRAVMSGDGAPDGGGERGVLCHQHLPLLAVPGDLSWTEGEH